MKTLRYTWRMAMRRKAACLLVVVAAAAMTIFMLFYPGLIHSTRVQLEETYAGIPVTGSIITSMIGEPPAISNGVWQELREGGYFSQLYASSRFSIRTFPKAILEAQAGPDASEQAKLLAFQELLTRYEENDSGGVGGQMRAYNTFQAADELVRIRDDILWLDGCDEGCLEGDDRICIVPASWGYAPGDTIPLLARTLTGYQYVEGIARLTVAGTYPGRITEFAAAMPLRTMEALTVDANAAQKQNGTYYEWNFSVDEVYFTVRDNQQLSEIKDLLISRGLRENDRLRVRIDDRVLKETVTPIESNLAQLEGSYLFFFFMIAAIGFFISFLLARGRRQEYAIMRLLGERAAQITAKALLEQSALCLLGVTLGAAAAAATTLGEISLPRCGVILLCYTLGAAAATLLTVHVNVMEILRDKE